MATISFTSPLVRVPASDFDAKLASMIEKAVVNVITFKNDSILERTLVNAANTILVKYRMQGQLQSLYVVDVATGELVGAFARQAETVAAPKLEDIVFEAKVPSAKKQSAPAKKQSAPAKKTIKQLADEAAAAMAAEDAPFS